MIHYRPELAPSQGFFRVFCKYFLLRNYNSHKKYLQKIVDTGEFYMVKLAQNMQKNFAYLKRQNKVGSKQRA